MSKQFKFWNLLCLLAIFFTLLSACSTEREKSLVGYDYRGVSIGDDKEKVIATLGEPHDIDQNDESGMYSVIIYTDAEFILKDDKVIAMSINRNFTLPNGVGIDDALSVAIVSFGAENLLHERNNSLTVNYLLEKNYAIALSFRGQEEELFSDSSIDSIMIADAKAMIESRGMDFELFKKNLVPVQFKERLEAQSEVVGDIEVEEEQAIDDIKYSEDFYGRWVPIGAQEGSSIYIELDEWDRGVLEFKNEGESLSYMMYAVERSEKETIIEYDDELGTTHRVTLSIQNGILHMSIDLGDSNTYERIT